jgi:aminoglycoside 3-N-acetyltransferase I
MPHPTGLEAGRMIRAASADDAPAIAELLRDAFAGIDAPETNAARSAEDIAAFLDAPHSIALVAIGSGLVIGVIAFVFEGAVARPFALAVDAAHRRDGVGSALLHAMERDARARGAVVLHVRARRHAAIGWLERRGYLVDREAEDVADGKTAEVIELVKAL